MASTFFAKRTLSPNWRETVKTIQNGEMDPYRINDSKAIAPDISPIIDSWRNNRSLSYAGELISTSIANGVNPDFDILNAAEFAVSQPGVSKPLKELALSILNRNITREETSASPLTKLDNVKGTIRNEINLLRQKISANPYCAMHHSNMARAYLRIGKWEKARCETIIATRLAPNDRYITRCGVRFFIHVKDYDAAKYILTHNFALKIDPWLAAADLEVDILRQKSPRSAKIAFSMTENRNLLPRSVSEVAIALATLEMIHGSQRKKVKRLVTTALTDPIDNAVAQAMWLDSVSFGNLVTLNYFHGQNIPFNYEADCILALQGGDWDLAMEKGVDWAIDTGFSRRAAVNASNIFSYHDEYIPTAIKVCEMGLTANPECDSLLNNLAFTHLLNDDVEKAKFDIERIERLGSIDKRTDICFTATKGLYCYRTGDKVRGNELYMQAIDEATRTKEKDFENNARLNHIRARLYASDISKEEARRQIDDIQSASPLINRLKTYISQKFNL